MSWFDKLSEAGGELIGAVGNAGGAWITGSVENKLQQDKASQSDPDEQRKNQVNGQTADGQPLGGSLIPSGYMTPILIGGGVLVLVVLVMLVRGK